ncbi:FCD domain-containing protein [Pseudovibrio exalbescens]|uniref:FadR/GntR family transcriptional regulator n=1 Tax=Pseudovibrio exalbescens TaxID=197461 RepID=UPI0023671511|nr:FCD domain-containing protein [Pseudovibrio exalbescens]MDD7911674.1 FCD domain-containing protein [Pseudovibrio exalbescens]
MAGTGASDRKAQVLERLAQLLFSGSIKPGGLLPKELELCAQYAVSRATIRSCLGELVSYGIVSRTSGQGTYVQPYEDWMILAPTVASWIAAYSDDSLPFSREMFRFRVTTEPYVSAEAALKAKASDLAAMETALEGMVQAHDSGKKSYQGRSLGEWDIDLHEAVYRASQSLIWLQFSKSLRPAFFSSIRRTTQQAESDMTSSLELHRALVEAIRLRDVQAAFECSCKILLRSANDLGDTLTAEAIGEMRHARLKS